MGILIIHTNIIIHLYIIILKSFTSEGLALKNKNYWRSGTDFKHEAQCRQHKEFL